MTIVHPQEVSDPQGHLYQVYTTSEDEYFGVCLINERTRVGYVRCTIDAPGEMTLCDITVLPEALIRRNFLQRVWDRLLGLHPRRGNYQGRGIGTLLLKMAIDEARRRKVSRIVGTVVDRDFTKHPKLTDWYAKHGFTISPVEPSDLPGAVYRIELYLYE